MSMSEIYNIRRDISNSQNRLYELKRTIREKEKELASLEALGSKSMNSKRESLGELHSKKNSLSSLEAISKKSKVVTEYYSKMRSYIDGNTKATIDVEYEGVAQHIVVEKKRLYEEIRSLERRVGYFSQRINTSRVALRSAIEEHNEKE